MKSSISIFSLLVTGMWIAVVAANAQVNVTQEHNNLSPNTSKVGVLLSADATRNTQGAGTVF